MLKAYIEKAKQGQCVWLPDVRDALSGSSAAVPVIFSLTLCTGERIDRCHRADRQAQSGGRAGEGLLQHRRRYRRNGH